ncbi:TonB-dependent receptor [Sandaracinobacteroides saxicola]|uniref:TonB-dependent receptor n=1 Tax=Sandaracinobacteroides saxicola TaxID=2759707 RepID=A0A7G5IK98_9SPHN|nr:TonB-dependent receptor [Sandaracinobacteroides saxicola]QMW23790.1 TonB-dependent receptor [Sandaracinobacteroides saxicola]
MTKGWYFAHTSMVALFSGSVLTVATPALAQAASAEDVATAEIVVTAQKREERLRDVPMSVSALTAADIENRNVTSLDQLQSAVPALRLVDIGPGQQRIQLRGISQYLGLPTVGLYIDEFPINTYGPSGSAEVRLLDIERIEVLRGPQPGLYGEGSMGGTIRYVTAKPNLTTISGSGLAEVTFPKDGDTGYRVEGIVNAPLVADMVGLRIAATHEKEGGWIDGAPGNNLNGRNTTTARVTLLAKASDTFKITLSGLYNESDQLFKSYSNATRGRTGQIVPSNARQRYWLGTLNLEYDAGPVTLVSTTGYLDQTSRSVDDSGPFYNKLFGAPLLRTALTDARGGLKKFHQELRLSSNNDGPLRYLVGASYTDGKNKGLTDGNGESLVPGLPPSALGVVFQQDSKTQSKIFAAFGSVGYTFGDLVTVDLSGRYFSDRRTSVGTFNLVGFGPPQLTNQKGTFDSFNPRLAVSMKTGDTGIIYANVAKGFRSGGFNSITAPSVPATFAPEKLWSYELGLKQSFLNNRLFVEASIYYNDYNNIQTTVIVPNTAFAAVLGSGKASGPGVDFSVRAQPSRDLTFAASLGYNRMRFDTSSTDKIKGDPLDLVPDWNWSASIDYQPRLSDTVGLIAHADIGFTDKGFITLRQLPPVPGLNRVERSEAREVANLRLGVSFSQFEVYGFVNNVFDTYRIVNPQFGAFFEPTYTKPRTVGLGVKGKF